MTHPEVVTVHHIQRFNLCFVMLDVTISGLWNRDFIQIEKFLSRHKKKLTDITIALDIENLNEHAVRAYVNDCIRLLHYAIENMKDL